MPMIRKTALSLLTLPPLLLGEPAFAAMEGWYYGISGGQTQADIGQVDLDAFADFFFANAGAPLLAGASTLEDSDTAWSIFFGYQFSPYFATEVAYLDLGSYPYRFSGAAELAGPVPAGLGFEFETAGISMAGVGVLPLGYLFELQGRFGIFFSDTKAAFSASLDNETLANSVSASASDLFFGIGLAMNLGDSWSIRVDWQRFQDVGNDEVTTETDIDSISLSLIYRLGPF